MFEPSGCRHFQQHSPWESSACTNCMIAPAEHGQHKSLPATVNPCRVSANLGFNGFGFSGFPDRGLTDETLLTRTQGHGERISMFPSKVGEKSSTSELPSQQKRFLIFDRSGNETRVIFSSLCHQPENRTNPLPTCPAWKFPQESVDTYDRYLAVKQGRIAEQVWTRTPALCEESGENEIVDEVSEIREDSEEINALLYSDDDDDNYDDDDDEEEVSSGHSPYSTQRDFPKQEDKKDFDSESASKLHGGCKKRHQHPPFEDTSDGDLTCPKVGTKRARNDNIHNTLRVLERIIPGLNSKDPSVILDESITYLKSLKYTAETMSTEDPASSSSACYQPLQ